MDGARDSQCVFCRIVAGEIPSTKVYEDEQVLGFVDIGPLAPGHVLVIPKGHFERLEDVPPEVAGACGAALPRLGKAVCSAVGASAWNVLQNNGKAAGQAVMHVHFHIIPKVQGRGLPFDWPAGKLSGEEARDLGRKVRELIEP